MLVKLLLHPGEQLDEYGEIEKLCKNCGDYWPADKEFFFGNTKGVRGLGALCKACSYDIYRPTKPMKDFVWEDRLFPDRPEYFALR